MYFPKLEDIKIHDELNEYTVKRLDEWLGSKPTRYLEYINPLEFITEINISRELGLTLFSVAADENNFEGDPFFQIKYIVNCPHCKEHFKTYYSNEDIPTSFVECEEEGCSSFIPAEHPERVYIFFKTKERPIVKKSKEKKVYKKAPTGYLTRADEDAREHFEFRRRYWKYEEEKDK
ncbi:hypothetical protein SAMN05192559_10486 [Halobacillus karajensis]|uniref:hypothetical protein n=1 Tax=Halobacillus karajensis TaxID=195088 RepID=UPI0008A79973|nr:hypothetical protein [Halobacillus karajensis]SEH78207.1 hypothetical protein SAMN05192559_10486 [Halobacillus karajensis]